MKRVLDSHGLITFLEREPGFREIASFFLEAAEADDNLLMTAVNWGEVYYISLRETGKDKTEEMEKLVQTLPIEVLPVDMTLAREAAKFKAARKLSYADCFAAALANLNGAELVTGDREFATVEGEIKIAWVGKGAG